jgi:uncharacterized protein
MDKYGWFIVVSIVIGTISRAYLMKIDYRQYPSYPQGYVSHLALGLIAASLGSVAVPALIEKQYAAVTFLAMAAQQFRDVRNMERQSLDNIEPTELIPRGIAYIEDIAKAFEARNYITMLTSLTASVFGFILRFQFKLSLPISLIGSIVATWMLVMWLKKKFVVKVTLGDMAEIKERKIEFNGPLLTINKTTIMNVGLEASREIYLSEGLAVEIIPTDKNALATLANMGQRQAVQHNVAVQIGIKKDMDEPDFTPLIRRNPENGNLVMAVIPIEKDMEKLINIIKSTPILESSRRKPTG